MIFVPTAIDGCVVVKPEPFEDERGFFARVWCADEFGSAGLDASISQINLSGSVHAGTIRGLHWQQAPHEESKVVRCISGRAFDVCVDLRAGSPTLHQWHGVELDPTNRLALVVPRGCAHGYQTLEPDTQMLYSSSAPYAAPAELGARWDDPAFGIRWPLTSDLTISEKDRSWPDVPAGRS